MSVLLYLGSELTEQELRDACNFDDNNIAIANQTQIDFIMCEPDTTELPYEMRRNLTFCTEYECTKGSFRCEYKSVFIFWH
jgi:hypothetical protein